MSDTAIEGENATGAGVGSVASARWIDPAFPAPADPNEISFWRFRRHRHLSRKSLLRSIFFGGILNVGLLAIFPMFAIEGLVAWNLRLTLMALGMMTVAVGSYQRLSEIVVANFPGSLAPRRSRIALRLAFLAIPVCLTLVGRPVIVSWFEQFPSSEARIEFDAVPSPETDEIVDRAVSRSTVALDVMFVLFSFAGISGELRAAPTQGRLDSGLRALGSETLGEPIASVAHLSDLHLTSPGAKLVSGGPSPNEAWDRLWLASQEAFERSDLILVSGDLTDTGAADEWGLAMSYLARLPEKRALIIPGNHDVSIVAREKWAMEGESGFLRALRLVRMIAAMDAVQGDRSQVFDGDNLVPLAKYLDPFRAAISEFTVRPPYFRKAIGAARVRSALLDSKPSPDLAYSLISMVWQEVFPQCVELAERKIVCFLLNSNELGSNIINNAFGSIEGDQLGRLRRMLERYSGWSRIVMLHHHLALPHFHEKPIPGVFARLMVLLNAAEVLALLTGGDEVAVFHGHRHIAYRGTIDETVQILSAASASLGDEVTGAPPCVDLYTLFRAARGGTLVQSASSAETR